MALELDLLKQITNVHWEEEDEGAVFVAGGYSEFVLYSKIDKKEDVTEKDKVVFTDLGPLDFTIQGGATTWPGANVSAGAYIRTGPSAKPTFVLGGNDAVQNPATLAFGSGAVIMMSHDGQSWTNVFRKQWPDHPDNQGGIYNFAIDGPNIYGNAGSVEYYSIQPGLHQILVSKTYERLVVSSDGEAWSEAGEKLRYDSGENWPNPPPPNQSPPELFMPHVNQKTNLPDGKFAYHETKNEKGKIIESYLAVPEKFDSEWWLSAFMLVDRYGPNVKITITTLKDDGETEETTVSIKRTPVKYVTCVAHASEILMVGGMTDSDRAQIAASIDDGKTWKVVWTADNPSYLNINTITAAPLSDMKTEEPTA